MRDMGKKEFERALARHGFRAEGFMGYYRLNVKQHICVSIWNAGANRRAQLAYLLKKQEEHEEEEAKSRPATSTQETPHEQ